MPTRIEIERDVESERFSQGEIEDLLRQWVKEVLDQLDSTSGSTSEKKNT